MTTTMLTELYYGGINEELQRKYAGHQVTYQTHRNRMWQLGVIPPIGDDDINGDYIDEFPVFIILVKFDDR
jgi:hypothetical protein